VIHSTIFFFNSRVYYKKMAKKIIAYHPEVLADKKKGKEALEVLKQGKENSVGKGKKQLKSAPPFYKTNAIIAVMNISPAESEELVSSLSHNEKLPKIKEKQL